MINEVRADSPAAKAGLKAGDIVVEADGKELKDEGELIRAIHEKKEGDVSLTIVRQGTRQTIRVTPEEVKDGSSSFFYIHPTPPDAPSSQPSAPMQWPRIPSGSLFPVLKFPGRIH
jgi:membrane-associated protease RseP (regulator of RpoE activity)